MYLKWRGKRAYAVQKVKEGSRFVERWEPLGKFHRKHDGQAEFLRYLKIKSDEPDKQAKFTDIEPSFWEWYQATHSPLTVKAAVNHWEVIKAEFSACFVSEIDANRVTGFKSSHDWSTATWKNRLILLKQFIEYAKSNGFKTANPFATIKIKQQKLHELAPKYPSKDQIEVLLERMRENSDAKNYLTALFLAYTGMRPIEFFRLKKTDVKGGNLKVFAKNKTRFIPIHPRLGEHLSMIPLGHSENAFRLALKRTCRALKWAENEITPNSFRHYFGTELLRKTKNLRLVGQVMGHATLQVTARYAWVLDDDQRAGVEMLD